MPLDKVSKINKNKFALVLSGGVVRAASWHLGVALALEELGFTFHSSSNQQPTSKRLNISTFVGSSAGSIINAYLTSGFNPNEIIESVLGMKDHIKPLTYSDMYHLKRPKLQKTQNKTYKTAYNNFPFSIKRLIKPLTSISGFFSTEGLRKYILHNVLSSDDFSDYSADMFIVATQLDHSRKVIFGKYNYPNPRHDRTASYYTGCKISDAIAASISVPPFYCTYHIKNNYNNEIEYYIDGEIRDTLSSHVAVDNGCDFIISSWTHTPYHFHDEVGSLVNYGLPAICIQAIYLMVQKKIISAKAQRFAANDLYNTIHSYMKSEKFSTQHTKDILNIIEKKLNYKSHVQFIDIYPDHKDFDVFFANAFSLDKNTMAQIVKKGYKKTLQTFHQLDL
jgi:predicted acylesterase/phospholipase RssA